MKIFISWSGNRGREMALALKGWIPRVLHATEPFMSDKDVVPGSSWLKEITSRLAKSHIGIICLTPESLHKPWLNFEAGALTRELKGRKNLVIPYLLGFERKELSGPLSFFQSVLADRPGTLELVTTLNAELSRRQEHPLRDHVLLETFEKWWPDLTHQLNSDVMRKEADEAHEESKGDCQFASFYYGVCTGPRRGNVFQDFHPVSAKRGNVNAIQNMWADTRAGSHLSVRVRTAMLEVVATNQPGSFPCNVAIRGKDDSPLLNDPYQRYLMFRVILAANDQVPEPAGVSIGVRVVNGQLQHWELESPICIDRSRPDVTADLRDPDKWKRFRSDGNPDGPDAASFDCICSVIIEFIYEGQVNLEIGPLVLLNDPQDYHNFTTPSVSGS